MPLLLLTNELKMINRYLKGFYMNILSLIAKVIYWFTIIVSFGKESLFFIYEEWILFLIYAFITGYISSVILKEQNLAISDDEEQSQTLKSELKVALVILAIITIALIILMIFLKNYEAIILIILMNALTLNLYRLIYKQVELRSLEN